MRQLTSYKVLLLSFLKTVPSWVMTMTLNTILNKIKSGDLHFFVISKDLHITKRLKVDKLRRNSYLLIKLFLMKNNM